MEAFAPPLSEFSAAGCAFYLSSQRISVTYSACSELAVVKADANVGHPQPQDTTVRLLKAPARNRFRGFSLSCALLPTGAGLYLSLVLTFCAQLPGVAPAASHGEPVYNRFTGDVDGDGVSDASDNCPVDSNPLTTDYTSLRRNPRGSIAAWGVTSGWLNFGQVTSHPTGI